MVSRLFRHRLSRLSRKSFTWTSGLPPLVDKLAIYGVEGDLLVDGEAVTARTLAVLTPAVVTRISADTAARVMVVRGNTLDGDRFNCWKLIPAIRNASFRQR